MKLRTNKDLEEKLRKVQEYQIELKHKWLELDESGNKTTFKHGRVKCED